MAYWLFLILYLVLGFWSAWPLSGANARPAAGSLLLFVLLVILGWSAFGPPIK